ncbi:MAG: glycosyltransferase family 4 protein [Actinomycetia bacterium]|nr:glycosyltransferase family 4 protein [Actinomycetes bacterium]
MRALMLVWTNVANDARVLREAAALGEAGHQVHVVGRDVPDGFVPPPGVTVSSAGGTSGLKRAAGGAAASRSTPVRAARWALLPSHVAAAHRSWVEAAARDAAGREFDVVHAHDFTALPLGARLARDRRVPYVYDTHEFWPGRPRHGRPTPLVRRREMAAERHLGAAAVAVLTVGPGVADRLRSVYGWPHVTVVRNTFPARLQDDPPLPEVPVGAVYAGRIAPYREIETIARAVPRLAPLAVTLVGPADPTYLAGLDTGGAGVMAPVPVDEVDVLLRRNGLALVTHSDRWVNHRLALPNKLFHAVHAGVPVVATDVEELGRVVRDHGIGTLYRPGDADGLVRAVREAVARYPELLAAVRRAAPELSWAHDADALLAVYRDIERAGVAP